MERSLVEGKIPGGRCENIGEGVRDSIGRLMGYDAPSKSRHRDVGANTAISTDS